MEDPQTPTPEMERPKVDHLQDLADRHEADKDRKFWLALLLVNLPLAYWNDDDTPEVSAKYIVRFLSVYAANLLIPLLFAWIYSVIVKHERKETGRTRLSRRAYVISYAACLLLERLGSGKRIL